MVGGGVASKHGGLPGGLVPLPVVLTPFLLLGFYLGLGRFGMVLALRLLARWRGLSWGFASGAFPCRLAGFCPF